MLQPKKEAIKKELFGKKIPSDKLKKVADSLDNVSNEKSQSAIQRTIKSGYDDVSKELNRQSKKDSDNATRYRTLANSAEKASLKNAKDFVSNKKK